MEMRDEWISSVCEWASRNRNVREIWLFGSRANGTARPDSDVDLAIALTPPTTHGYALGNWGALKEKWKDELKAMVGRHVSLEAIVPDTLADACVRRDGRLLWEQIAPDEWNTGQLPEERRADLDRALPFEAIARTIAAEAQVCFAEIVPIERRQLPISRMHVR